MDDDERSGTGGHAGSDRPRPLPPAPWDRPWATTPRPPRPTPRTDSAEAKEPTPVRELTVSELIDKVGEDASTGRRQRRAERARSKHKPKTDSPTNPKSRSGRQVEDSSHEEYLSALAEDTAILPRMPEPYLPLGAVEPRPPRVRHELPTPRRPEPARVQEPLAAPSPPAEPETNAPAVPTRLQAKRARRRRRSTVLRRSLATMTALLVFLVTGAAWGTTKYVDANLNKVDALDQSSSSVQNPDAQRGDENYLLVGTDSRAGSNGAVGAGTTADAGGARSDTVMLAHVPANRGRVVVVSFPRDLEIDRPSCTEWNNTDATYNSNTTVPAEKRSKLNAAYATGGPKCLVQVIQQISGLKINHFVGVDFAGFEALVNQIGGVEVCAKAPLVDDELGTVLAKAGTQVIDGKTALNYVRARKVEAEGTGDYGRITRQQRFLSSLLRKAMSTDVLLNFGKLTGFISGFTATTFGENIGADSLITLGQSLQGLSAGRVTFITVPTTGTRDGNEVPNSREITTIFHAIIDDAPLPGEQGAGSAPRTSAAPTPTTAAPKPGGSAQIDVLNATSTSGLAASTAKQLTDLGYTIDEITTASSTRATTTIRYSAEQTDAAKQLASSVPNAQLQAVPGLGATIELVLGKDFDGGISAPSTSATSAPPTTLPSNLAVVNAGDASCG